jgi:hypothetical protein
MRRTMIIEGDRAFASERAAAQNLWMRCQNQSPRTGAGRENPLRKMMFRPLADARNKNETDGDGSFTARLGLSVHTVRVRSLFIDTAATVAAPPS